MLMFSSVLYLYINVPFNVCNCGLSIPLLNEYYSNAAAVKMSFRRREVKNQFSLIQSCWKMYLNLRPTWVL